MDEERDLYMLNRSKRPKLTVFEIAELGNWNRPLTKNGMLEMAIGKKCVTLEVMGAWDEHNPGETRTDATNVTINLATDIPEGAKPPPKAPGNVQTYSSDPSTGIGHYLGDSERKEKDTKGKSFRGNDSKRKRPQRVRARRRRFPMKRLDRERSHRKGDSDKDEDKVEGNMSLSTEEMMPPSIILRIRHGGDWAPTGTMGERQYREYSGSWGNWQYRDGACREMRDQTAVEIDAIDGSTHRVDIG